MKTIKKSINVLDLSTGAIAEKLAGNGFYLPSGLGLLTMQIEQIKEILDGKTF